jgi:Tol biopolymer transport system component
MAANLWYNQDTGKYELRMWDVQAGTMRLLADHFTEFDAILWTPDGRYLLFEAAVATALDPSPTGALYRANPATGDIKRLTATVMNDYLRPVVSPDSTRVAYMWWNQRSEDATAEMRVVNIDTGAVQRLTEYDADYDLSWSFNSRYIAFGFGNLVALNSATGQTCDLGQKLVNPAPLYQQYEQVTWSPTDHSLIVRLRDKVYWMDMGTFNTLPVSAGVAFPLDAAWSPDGRSIALVTQGDRGSNKLYVVDTPRASGTPTALDQCLAKSSG